MMEIKIPVRCKVEIDLFGGGKLGTLTVATDIDFYKGNYQELVRDMVERQIRKCFDMIVMEGAVAVAKKQ